MELSWADLDVFNKISFCKSLGVTGIIEHNFKGANNINSMELGPLKINTYSVGLVYIIYG